MYNSVGSPTYYALILRFFAKCQNDVVWLFNGFVRLFRYIPKPYIPTHHTKYYNCNNYYCKKYPFNDLSMWRFQI